MARGCTALNTGILQKHNSATNGHYESSGPLQSGLTMLPLRGVDDVPVTLGNQQGHAYTHRRESAPRMVQISENPECRGFQLDEC
jgi:hypothetical protein